MLRLNNMLILLTKTILPMVNPVNELSNCVVLSVMRLSFNKTVKAGHIDQIFIVGGQIRGKIVDPVSNTLMIDGQ